MIRNAAAEGALPEADGSEPELAVGEVIICLRVVK